MNCSPSVYQSPELQFQPYLPVMAEAVYGNVDYRQWRSELEGLDRLLRVSGLESRAVGAALERHEKTARSGVKVYQNCR